MRLNLLRLGPEQDWRSSRRVSGSLCKGTCVSAQETKPRGRSAVPGRCRGGPESPAPKSTGKSAKARTAAAMERNRRGARKFRERQSQRPPCPFGVDEENTYH
jgi:hypothetical protein